MQKKQSYTLIVLSICILFQSAFGTVSLRVYYRDEGLNEMNISKPRIYIQNIGDELVSDIYCYYYITTEDNKTPILDDYYTPDASVSLENLNNGNYRIRYDFSGTTINPGQIKPNPDGNVVVLHYSNWSTWDKTNDFSNTELSTFSLNGNVPVYTSDGTLVYGNKPTDSNNPPQPPKVSTGTHDYAVLSKEYADIRDRVIIKGGDAGSGVYLEVGANSVVNGNVFSCGNMFLRSNDTIKGDAIAGEDVNTQNGAVVTGTIRSHAQLEIPEILVESVLFGTDDVIVNDDGTIDLQPGSYKDFHAYSRSTIIMHPGAYFFNKFFLETDVNIILKVSNTQRLNLNVNSSLRFGDRTTMSFEQGTAYPYSVKIYSAQIGQVFIGNTCQIYGNIICPDAEVHVYSNTRINGALYGKKVIIEPGSEVCKPPLLQDFWYSEWAYSPSFNPTVFDYKAAVPDATVTLTISTISPDGTIVIINGQQSKESTVTLTGNITNIPILLSNSDQCGTTAYNLEITKTSNYQIFVNDDSPALQGQEDGNSWATAYKDLQQALDRALVEGKEIWVAEGTYKPTRRVDPIDLRSATFMINTGIEIKGGFKGFEIEDKPKGNLFETILSGDINKNDEGTWPPLNNANLGDNTYHVVTIDGSVNAKSIKLDRITITGGVADYNGEKRTGAGILIKNCTPTLNFVHIVKNIADSSGAGIFDNGGIVKLDRCLVEKNVSKKGSGAGYFSTSGRTEIIGCVFDGNSVLDTSINTGGGAIWFGNVIAKIQNCIFTGNSTLRDGGAIYNNSGYLVIDACSFVMNSAAINSQSIMNKANTMIENCILWNDLSRIEIFGGNTTVVYSCITGGFPGEGNIDANPLFVNSDDPKGDDGLYGTDDDGLQLTYGSPCIDIGYESDNDVDLKYIPRPQGEKSDIGAYEYIEKVTSASILGVLAGNEFVCKDGFPLIPFMLDKSDIPLYMGSKIGRIMRIAVPKNKYTKNRSDGYALVRWRDKSGNTLPGSVDIKVHMVKVGEDNNNLYFQSSTMNGKPKGVLFVADLQFQNFSNEWAYIILIEEEGFLEIIVPVQ